MKKLLAIILAVLMVAALFVACNDSASSDDDDKGSDKSSSQTASGEGSGEGNGTVTNKTLKSKEIKIDSDGSQVIQVEWDMDNAKLYLYSIMYAPESALGDKYEGPLSMVQKYTYSVDNRGSVDGGYVIDGALQSVKLSMEGPSASAYIEDNKDSMGDMYDMIKNGTELTGEELQSFQQRTEMKFEANLTLSGTEILVNNFIELYTTYGDQAKHKDIMTFKNGIISKVEMYYNGELESAIEYDANGNPINNASQETVVG